MEKYLQARELRKVYKGRTVVDGVSIEVRPGEIVGLLGPNGAGKTTTFYMITGIVRPNSGTIHLNEKDVTKLPMYMRARKGIGYLPQEPSIFRKLTVEDNLMLILEHRGMSYKKQKAKANELLEEFGITKIRKSRGYVLSGGERRRVEIARALATDPTFLLLDEPFTGIDPISVQDLQELMVSLKKRGLGVLITDHSVRETLEITDRSYIMYDSKILKSGSSREILSDPEARRLYLGDRFTLEMNLGDSLEKAKREAELPLEVEGETTTAAGAETETKPADDSTETKTETQTESDAETSVETETSVAFETSTVAETKTETNTEAVENSPNDIEIKPESEVAPAPETDSKDDAKKKKGFWSNRKHIKNETEKKPGK